jgi:hypothetical protein
MASVEALAEKVRQDRKPVASDNPFTGMQENVSRQIVCAFNAWRDAGEALAERAAVDLADIDGLDLAREEIADGGFEVPGNADFLGEMVQRAHRKNAKDAVGAGELPGHGVDRSVTASRRHRVTVLAQGSAAKAEMSSPR